MPVLQPRRKPHHVTGADLLDRGALALHPSEPGGDDQHLPERMRMPRGASTRLERDLAGTDARGLRRLEQRVDTNRPGEPVFRTFLRGPRTISFDVDVHTKPLHWLGRLRPRPINCD